MTEIPQSVFNKIRKNKYILILTLPKILRDLDTNNARTNELVNNDSLQYSVFSIPIPRVRVPSVPLQVYGQTYNVTSQTREPYAPITVGFTVDNRLNNYWVLWKWLEVLNHPRDSGMPSHFAEFKEVGQEVTTNTPKYEKSSQDNPIAFKTQKEVMVNDYLDYQTLVTVYALDEYNVKIAKFTYYNAFITELAEINYSYRDPEEVESSFTFAFSQMDIELI